MCYSSYKLDEWTEMLNVQQNEAYKYLGILRGITSNMDKFSKEYISKEWEKW